jgi:hypothetical protein
MTTWVRRHYGAGPLHLIGHLVAFFVAAWALTQILGGRGMINWIAWFLGAALLHDIVALPIYSALDRALGLATPRRRPPAGRPAALNHLRVPAAIAGVLLLVYFPLILGKSSRNYLNDTGHPLAGYTRNWLLITAGLFAASLVIYLARTAIRRTRRPRPPRDHRPARPR